jgi:DNA-binding beta-propeller fold protein YncE
VATILAAVLCCTQPPSSGADVVATGLDLPRAIAVGSDGTLYVADSGNARVPGSGRVLKLVQDRLVPVLTGIFNHIEVLNGQTFLYGVSGVATFGEAVYVLLGAGAFVREPTLGENQLVRLDPSGPTSLFSHAQFAGRNLSSAAESNASAVAIDRDGTIWTTDATGNWIVHLTGDGRVLSWTRFPGTDRGPAIPTGIAISSQGDVLVALFRCQQPTGGLGAVVRLDRTNTVEIAVGDLNSPIGVASDSQGTLYIVEFADAYDARTGRLIAVRGDDRHVIADGLDYPTALAWDPRGFVWVATGSPSGEPRTGRLLRYRA